LDDNIKMNLSEGKPNATAPYSEGANMHLLPSKVPAATSEEKDK
jgi:hypothetical protein